ncbi:MAG: phosphoribosylanthranilate isomerase [Thermoflexibacter sp.]|jgi:phosphoribosylanthranilate isomerase|nr:phosphoribosylanthranilate isomerase [Thermoflexibacter sp.]
MKIKVCGMREPQNITDVVALGIDYIGFIFYQQSPRYVGNFQKELMRIKTLNESKTQYVGVFVNHSLEFMIEKVKEYDLDLVQLHGHETAEFCSELRERSSEAQISVKFIKVFSMGEGFDFSQLIDYKPLVDYFLFDTKGKNLGGNGLTFDWRILENYDNEIPFFLSGGLDIHHHEEIKALKHLNIHALDINSKFEINAGLKDVEKISRFLALL